VGQQRPLVPTFPLQRYEKRTVCAILQNNDFVPKSVFSLWKHVEVELFLGGLDDELTRWF
jgi:hypothetical protein